jgi:peptide/nickel transport system substrate-binding protein
VRATPLSQPVVAAAPVVPSTGGADTGTVVIGVIQEPDNLNPVLWGTDVAGAVGELIYSKLLKLDSSGQFIPDLATAVPTADNGGVTADGLTYTFRLRNNARFQDGVPLTCADVKFTWEIALDQNTRTKDRQLWHSAASGGVSCTDDNTAVFRLTQPINNMLEVISLYGILPRHLLTGKDINTDAFNTRPIGSGPFQLTEWVKGDHLSLTRNADYYLGRPHLDGIVVRYMPDANALLAATQRGELDIRLGITADQLSTAGQIPGYDLVSVPIQSIFHLYLNWQRPGLGETPVRLALAHAIDKEAIARSVLRGTVTPVDVPVPPQSWAYAPPPKLAYDPALARQFLDEAGWVAGADGVRVKDGQQLKFTVLVVPEFERIQTLQIVLQQWKAIGVEAELTQNDVATWSQRMSRGEFDIGYGFYSYTYSVDNRGLLACDPNIGNRNYGHWCVSGLDQLLAQAASSTDQVARTNLLKQFQQEYVKELPVIPLFARSESESVSKKVHGYQPNPYQTQGISHFWSSWQWSKDP